MEGGSGRSSRSGRPYACARRRTERRRARCSACGARCRSGACGYSRPFCKTGHPAWSGGFRQHSRRRIRPQPDQAFLCGRGDQAAVLAVDHAAGEAAGALCGRAMSGILLPMALAPDWLRFLSTINPLTHAVDAVRAIFNGQWGNRRSSSAPSSRPCSRCWPCASPGARSRAPTPDDASHSTSHAAGGPGGPAGGVLRVAALYNRRHDRPPDQGAHRQARASTATTAAPRSSPAACATRASRSSTPASARRPR